MSELYQLPAGWEWKKLNDIVRFGCEKGFQPQIINDMVPFIGMSNIDESKGRETTYTLEKYESVSNGKTKFQKGAILVGKITPCTQNNKVSIVPNEINGGFATTEVFALHCFEDMLPLFLNYFIRSKKINNYLVSTMIGATGRQRIPTDILKNLGIPVPALTEQKRIVQKLDALFERIDKAIALLQKNISAADNFMNSVLNDVFSDLEQNFNIVELSEIVSKLGDGLHGTPKYDESGEYYFINGANIKDGEIVVNDNTKKVNLEEYKKYRKELNDRTILVSINGTIGNVGIYNNEKCILGKSACYFNLLDGVDKIYVTYVIKSDSFQEYIRNNATGATIKNVSLKTMRESKLVIPPLKIQQKVVAYLDNISAQIEQVKSAQQQKMQSLLNLKSSILDQAFHGKL